jgi:lipid A 3-O-deacylase
MDDTHQLLQHHSRCRRRNHGHASPLPWRDGSMTMLRWLATLTLALLGAALQIAAADEPPSLQVFVQAGMAEDAHAVVVGVTQPWSWQREFASGRASGYWEASFGRWSSEFDDGRRSNTWVTQVGVTPVLRWQPRTWGERGFVEAGIGANLLLPVYRSGDKRFSTAFNFGDHIAMGWRFGARRRHELALRLQHFSNAGIRHPNPGEDFVQLRWAWRP